AVGMLPEGGATCPQFMALQWRAQWLEGDTDGALETAKAAMQRFPEDPDACLEVADVLTELGGIEAAADLLLEAAQRLGKEPELLYEAGIVLERLGRWDLRLQCFKRVWELDREVGSMAPMWLPEARFLEVARESVDDLPEHVREALGNVVLLIEDYPERWIFDTEIADPRLLGLFDGAGRAAEAGYDGVPTGPSRVYLYRWNIERMCHSAEEVEEQIAITVRHEIGHYLGLDEDELHARGLG
ncbi:MAG: metallopeptidase family protein, partial [Myxococcota bacterium]|nr:metallopeptidase family protein [Myxococcota bacterium]